MGLEDPEPTWTVLGEVDIREPGRYEIVFCDGVGAGIRLLDSPAESPIVVGATDAVHPCRPCTCCGGCACAYAYGGRTTCRACTEYLNWAATAEPALEHYLAAAGQPDAFVETDERTHVAGCPSLKRTIADATRALDAGCTHQPEWWARVPTLSDATPRRKRCRVCCPDVIVPVSRGPVQHGRFDDRSNGRDGPAAGPP